MVLDTTADVDQIEAVRDREGNTRPPANSDEQEAMNARLGNNASVVADKLDPATAGTQLPSHALAEGSEVLILADPANGGPIYVGPVGSPTVPLTKGNGLTFNIQNTDALEAKADNAGDTLHIVGEQ